MALPPQDLLRRALKAHREGDIAAAESLYAKLLRLVPNDFNALQLLGLIRAQQRKFAEADRLLARALEINATSEILNNHGSVLVELGRPEEAIVRLNRALLMRPDYAEAHYNLGNALSKAGRAEAASKSYAAAIRIRPAYVEALQNLSFELAELARHDEAVAALRRAIELNPRNAQLYDNLGVLFRRLGNLDDARMLAERAVEIFPDDAMTHFNLGLALRGLQRNAEAAAAYERALARDPRLMAAWVNLAVATEEIDRARSIEAQDQALSADPLDLIALNLRLRFRLQEGDFEGVEETTQNLIRSLEQNLEGTQNWRTLANVAYRALFVPLPDDLRRRVTDRIDVLNRGAVEASPRLPPLAGPDGSAVGRRLRIGYLTPNFSDHPVGHVTLELFPAHDRSRVEIHGIALGSRAGGDPAYNERHRRGVDHYHLLAGLPPVEVARRIRGLGIDILVDLDGYMETATTAPLAFRPAPLQVFWLGHAGGLGLSFVDYLIADGIVIPPGEESSYREAVIRMPECYHVASPAAIATEAPSRAASGLPQGAFVFGAFNNPEKIDRRVFSAWMKILADTPGSVLWLTKTEGVTAQIVTFRRQAQSRGIDPNRLIFADRLPAKSAHLARHRYIDLFLDTLTLNASTTALDALWAGTPLLAVRGDRFANRISNTMLMAIGQGDMIVDDLDSYVARAIYLAGHRDELGNIRQRLNRDRDRLALFDVGRFARHLEQAYEIIWQRYCRGEPAAGVDVPLLS